MASVAAGQGRSRPAEPIIKTTPSRLPIEYSLLLTATLCLLAGGAVMVYSASSPAAITGSSAGGMGQLLRFALYAGIGLVVLRYTARMGLDGVRRLTGPLLGVAFVLMVAVRLPGIGHSALGAQRWIGVGPFQFEPSELMKLALVLYAAHVLSRGRPSRPSRRMALKRLALVGGAACLLVASQPDIGTTLVIAAALIAIVLTAGIPLRVLLVTLVLGAGAVTTFAIAVPYAGNRLTSFVDPWAHANTTGFQAVQSQVAIGSGGLFGRGPGQSIQKDFYLPEAPTDFIFAVIGEELGFVGIAGLLALYGLIGYAGLRAARQAKGTYAVLIAIGTTSVIVFQASLNVFAALGLAPVTGVPLPFVSYGASNLLVMLVSMGLLLNVAGGGTAHLRAVRSTKGRKPRRSADEQAAASRDRSGGDRRARGARAGGRRRAGSAGS